MIVNDYVDVDAGDVEAALGRRFSGHVAEEFLVVLVPAQGVEARSVEIVDAVEQMVAADADGARDVDADDVQPPGPVCSDKHTLLSNYYSSLDVAFYYYFK